MLAVFVEIDARGFGGNEEKNRVQRPKYINVSMRNVSIVGESECMFWVLSSLNAFKKILM